MKKAELEYFEKLGVPAQWKSHVKKAAENGHSRVTTVGFILDLDDLIQEATSSSQELETCLLEFPPCAFALGDTSVQRDLCRKMKKMDLIVEVKETSEMEVDSAATGATEQAPAPASSSTIAAMIDKRIVDALKEIKGLLSAAPPSKKEAIESKFHSRKRERSPDNANLPCRKKVSAPRKGQAEGKWGFSPQGQKGGLQEGKGFPEKIWEEVREFRCQMGNRASSGNPLRIPNMYLDMSK